ncbi:hypothetical protein NUW58_g6102 [Xylaria curta]|uniref:Uncharacterized protein n=1 Tax=Xylaria curta TaxID=42375 RepID=A0ACC1NYE9_9PEZI|nr:hypothetical protein NUW58_g6102 [Xylaria curta]
MPFDYKKPSRGYPLGINLGSGMGRALASGFWLLFGTRLFVYASPTRQVTVGDTGITPDQIRDAFPPRDPFNASNWFGTSLYGYDGCNDISEHIKGWINEDYTDANKLVNMQGVKDEIDWNSAAALEYLGPPALNKDQQQQIQAVFANTATAAPGIAPFPNWIRVLFNVRCDDPAHACSERCPATQEDESEGQVIAYARNPNTSADRKWPDIRFCPILNRMRILDNAIAYGSGRHNHKDSQDIANYFFPASAFLYELFYLDLAADSVNESPNPQVTAYGPKHAKILARFLPRSPVLKQTGYFVQRNDDNFVYFALAKYIQSKTGLYPFLPVVVKHSDQSSDVEKAHQVAMIGEIFRLASRVVTWLGPEDNHSDRAMAWIKYMGSQADYSDIEGLLSAPTAPATELESPLPIEAADLAYLCHLFHRPWFERLWVRQEILLTNRNAIVYAAFLLYPGNCFDAVASLLISERAQVSSVVANSRPGKGYYAV